MPLSTRLRSAAKFSAKHLGISALVAAAAAAMVFGLWFPYPYNELAGGKQLFALVVAVDVIIGPLLSFCVYNPEKPKRELWRDLGVIFFVQFLALGYGVFSVTQARPVWLAFEGDRFRIVSVPDIHMDDLGRASENFRHLSWVGPKLVGVKLLEPTDPNFPDSIQLALKGYHSSFRPERWVEFDSQRSRVVKEAKPLAELRRRYPDRPDLIDKAIAQSALSEAELGFVPLASEGRTDWSVVVSLADGTPQYFLPLDAW